ncbi:MAG TPA: hypothetical protein VMS17_24980 [Gemmataceae bacterium]|nr:hypothetical protein [Gemmataceae bacterium]
MRMKLFIKDKSAFVGWIRFQHQLEDEINAWLADNPIIRIVHVTQSSNGGSFDTSKVWISVWYEEGTYPFGAVAEAARAAGLPASQGVTKSVQATDR